MTALGATTEAHTPTPWVIDNETPQIIRPIDQSERQFIAVTNPSDENPADTAFIVLACNSFDALTEANKKLVEIVDELITYAGGMELDTWHNFVQRAEAALDSARQVAP